MDWLHDFWKIITDSEDIIRSGGLLAIVIIVFIENGLFFGFFLPGDYLLFLAGVFCGTAVLKVPLALLMGCIFVAAVLGSLVGYISGRFFDDTIQNKKESFFFKKRHIAVTQKYFDKYGSRTLVISKFLPIVRTFAPILAGLIKMDFRKFLLFTLIGSAIWVAILVSAGYYLGTEFPWIMNYVHYIILFFLGVTTFTVLNGYLKAKKEMANTPED
jgi:membrane-associated protein